MFTSVPHGTLSKPIVPGHIIAFVVKARTNVLVLILFFGERVVLLLEYSVHAHCGVVSI